jgi:hypothetical protein
MCEYAFREPPRPCEKSVTGQRPVEVGGARRGAFLRAGIWM